MPARLEDASRSFYAALNDVLAGNPEPMTHLWSHEQDITYMSPFGELLVGWEAVRPSWQAQADQRLAGRVEPEDLHHFSSDGLGFVVGYERGSVQLDGRQTPVNIRATSMYRVEDGAWKMIGHHTDPLG
jgi:ketosteroid isomerase-like protein